MSATTQDERQRIRGYTLKAVLGLGAKTVVYEAERGGASYALKLLRADRPTTPTDRVTFRREAAALARVGHPSLPGVYEVGEHEGRPFLVLEIIRGSTVEVELSRGKLPEGRVFTLAKTLAEALVAAHRWGLIHRDIKPANVMLDDSSAGVRLIDFSMAYLPNEDAEGAGTLTYASPEQSGMLERPVDARSDLYALGGTLFECAAGRVAFESSSLSDLLHMHLKERPPLLHEIVPGFGERLSRVIDRLLEKDPDDRYQSAEELLQDLERFETRGAAEPPPRFDVRTEGSQLPLVGRDDALRPLLSAWDRVQHEGRGGFVLVDGESGFGKTRLVQELMSNARAEGAHLLQGRASAGNQVPLSPIRDLLATSLQGGGEALANRLRGIAGSDAPVLRRLGHRVALALGNPPRVDGSQEELIDVTARFLARVAKGIGPTLIFIDDVQWADEATLRLLAILGRHLHSVPLLVVMTARSAAEQTGTPVQTRLLEDAQAGTFSHLSVGPLEPAAANALVGSLLPGIEDERFLRVVFERAGGCPLVIEAMVQSCIDAGAVELEGSRSWRVDLQRLSALRLPDDAVGILLRRLDQMPETTREVLTEAALMGRRFDPRVLTRVYNDRPAVVMQALGEAMAASFVERGERFEYLFTHDNIVQAVKSQLTEEEQRRRHQAIAEAMDAIAADAAPDGEHADEHADGDEDVSFLYGVANHYAQGDAARNPARSFAACFSAGQAALAAADMEEARRFLAAASGIAEAHDLETPAALHAGIGAVAVSDGHLEPALASFAKALARTDDRWLRAEIYMAKAKTLMTNRQINGTSEQLRLAFAAADVPWPSLRPDRILVMVADLVSSTRTSADAEVEQDPQRRRELRIILELYETAYLLMYYSLEDKVRLAQTVIHPLRHAKAYGPSRALVRAHGGYVLLHGLLRRKGAMKAAVQQMNAVAEELGRPDALAFAARTESIAHIWSDAAEETEWLRRIDVLLEERGSSLDAFDYDSSTSVLCVHRAMRGDTASVIRATDRALRRFEQAAVNVTALLTESMLMRALAKAMLGDLHGAERDLPKVEQFGDSRYYLAFYLAHRPFHLLEIGASNDELRAALEEHAQVGVGVGAGSHYLRAFFLAKAWVLLHIAETEETAAAVAEFGRSLRDVDRAKLDHLEEHRLWLHAAYARLSGKHEKALSLLGEAADRARRVDSALGLFEVERQRMLTNVALGRVTAAEISLRIAAGIAKDMAWAPRHSAIVALGRSLSLSEHTGTSTRGSSSTRGGGEGARALAVSEQLRALMQVSLAAGTPGDIEQKSQNILAEIIPLLRVERALLFRVDEEGDLALETARDESGQKLQVVTDYGREVVAHVQRTRESTVLTAGGSDDSGLGHTLEQHGIKTAVAAPMRVGEKLVGIVYLESRTRRVSFSLAQIRLLNAMANHIAVAIQAARAAQVEMDMALLEKDLAVTAALQAILIPPQAEMTTRDWTLAAMYQPAEQSGGDWWWLQERSDGKVLLLLGDVTGHGAGPAMVTAAMASCAQVIEWEHGVDYDPELLLRAMNTTLFRLCQGEYHAVLTMLELDPQAGKGRGWFAGACPVVGIGPDGKVKVSSTVGPVLGMGDELSLNSIDIPWTPGTRLLVHTDGLSEVRNPKGRQLGFKSLVRWLQDTQGQSALEARTSIFLAWENYAQGGEQEDDVTFVVLDRHS